MNAPALGACARCLCPIEAGDLRCAICGLATPAEVTRPRVAPLRVLRCERCGAAVRYDVEAQAPRCAFCRSVMHVEGVTDPMEQTEHYLSFAAAPDAAKQALRRWLGGLGMFRPSDLVSEASVEKLEPLYWVGWVFEARARVSWTADSDVGARRSDWAPHAGQVAMAFEDVLVSASRGLTDEETRALAPSYDLRRRAGEPLGPEGAIVEHFDVQRSSARARIVEAAEAQAVEAVKRDHVPGSRTRNVRVAVLLEGLHAERCAFPAYVLAYRYRDTLYRAVVSGHDPSAIVGNAPLSLAKVLLAVLAVVAVVGALAFLALGG
jgi:hypothetical protein